MKIRNLDRVIPSTATSDGAGVKLRRSLGSTSGVRHDPFLMLDEFYSDDPRDYIAGFPPHPHRGFETVTYMLDGHMQHRDNRGNTGDLGPGDVQWMTAARGIVHSEMPQQTEGRMRGFQLWLNLPASEKMKPAAYRDIPAHEIPAVDLPGNVRVKVIAGELEHDGATTLGPAAAPSTQPHYFDVHLGPGAVFQTRLPESHNVAVYPYDGELLVGENREPVEHRAAGLLGDGHMLRLEAGPDGARTLVLAARPLGEPVVQHGPFVMNTREEIDQAIRDYQAGQF